MRDLLIGGRRIADDEPCYVIAELGHNHGGSLSCALEMIDAAAEAGASAVKLQKRENTTLYTTAALAKAYDNEFSYGPTYGAHRAALELTADQCAQCMQRASGRGLVCFATAFDEPSVDCLDALHMKALKLPSGALTDARLLAYAHGLQGRCGPILLSTGGGRQEDIDLAMKALEGCPRALLHCTASYPLAPEQANLLFIPKLRERFPSTVIGFSSHSPGIAFSLIAYAFGARIIEHHFTLNRASKGTDHGFSLEPKGLDTLVDDLDKLRLALGDGIKRFYPSERGPIGKMRRRMTLEGWRITGEPWHDTIDLDRTV